MMKVCYTGWTWITNQEPEHAKKLLEQCGHYPNFLISSGCDIPFHAKWENIQAFFAALH